MPSRLANSWRDRARPVASSSNHARPRTSTLIRAGSHLEPCVCCANPGRTNLVSAPRRVKAAAAVSSTALSLAASDAPDGTSLPNSAAPHFDDERFLIDDYLLDELSNGLRSFPR